MHRNIQLQDVVERLLAERKELLERVMGLSQQVISSNHLTATYIDADRLQLAKIKDLQERLLTEHSKVEYFQSCKEGAARKLGKEINELRAQVRTASDAADAINRAFMTEKRNNAQLEADLQLYAEKNTELHRQLDTWTDQQIELAVNHGLLCCEHEKLQTEVATLKDYLKMKDEEWQLMKQELQETQNKCNFLDKELMDVGMENAKLKEKVAEVKQTSLVCFTKVQAGIADIKRTLMKPPSVFAKRAHPAFRENKKREFARPENVISPPRLKRAKAIVGAALEAELNEF